METMIDERLLTGRKLWPEVLHVAQVMERQASDHFSCDVPACVAYELGYYDSRYMLMKHDGVDPHDEVSPEQVPSQYRPVISKLVRRISQDAERLLAVTEECGMDSLSVASPAGVAVDIRREFNESDEQVAG